MLKAAIVGCGKIAEAHAEVITNITGAVLAATCDREILMARQLAERYGAKKIYDDLSLMLAEVEPNVVHITTPPHSHYEIARTCLEAGCNVFIEKPFTVNTTEAEQLISLAISRKLKITVGTDEQFSPVALEMRKLVAEGWLGGHPVHLDVYYCYDLGDERYARVFIKDKSHWLWSLPGQLIQNIMPHAIIKVAEFLEGNHISIFARGFTSDFIKKMGETHLKDELRAIIIDEKQTTAYLTFSTQVRPSLRQFMILGPKNGLLVDQDHQALIKIPGQSYKSYLEKTWPLYQLARQYRKNLIKNVHRFLKKQFHMKRGLYNLIWLFYQSIETDSQPPIPYDQIILSSKIMDSIISQIYGAIEESKEKTQ